MRKKHTAAFKAKVTQEVLREEQSIAQLAAAYGVHPTQLHRWREVALQGLPSLFSTKEAQEQAAREVAHAQEVHDLYAHIGELTTHVAWLKKKSGGLCD